MRYTKAFIKARFEMAMRDLGVPVGETYTKQPDGTYKANVGVYFLDHTPCYGGYRVHRIANEGGAESTPFGSERYNAREMIAMLNGVLAASFINQHKG